MRSADSIARDILVLRLGDKNNAVLEHQRLTTLINGLDADISGGLLADKEKFAAGIKTQVFGEGMSKTALIMLNAVFKTISEPKSASMLGKLLFSEKTADKDYSLALLYRLLENMGLTIKAVPLGYDSLIGGISGNRLLEFTEHFQAVPEEPEPAADYTQADLLRALFIMNGEPDEDISGVKDCPALLEYKRLIAEAEEMDVLILEAIPEYTAYPNMALIMGLRVMARSGRAVEFSRETLERFVFSIMTGQSAVGM